MEPEVLWTDVAMVALVAAQLLVLIVAAIVAWRQVREARILREQQNRPFVVIDFELEGDSLVYLEVSNLGNSLARNVRFEIEPALESAVDVPVGKLKMITDGISTLAPGKRIRTFFDLGFRRGESDLPLTYSARVRYADETGQRHFDEILDLDLELFMHLSTVKRHDVHDVHEQLKRMTKVFEKWTWSGGGLLTLSPKQRQAENKRITRLIEKRRARDEKAQAAVPAEDETGEPSSDQLDSS